MIVMGNPGLLETIARLEAEVIRLGEENARLRMYNPHRGKLSDEQIAELHRLCNAGERTCFVAKKLGVSWEVAHYHRKKFGKLNKKAAG